MKVKTFLKVISFNAVAILALSGCHSEPKTPMEAVMSDVKTTKYTIDFYEDLSTADHQTYKSAIEYCQEHHNKPNCENVMLAEGNLFNRDPPRPKF